MNNVEIEETMQDIRGLSETLCAALASETVSSRNAFITARLLADKIAALEELVMPAEAEEKPRESAEAVQ